MRYAISIRQPYLWCITRPDIIGDEARRAAYRAKQIKDVENRSRAIRFSGEVFLHSSRTPADNYNVVRLQIQEKHDVTCPLFHDLPSGGIVGRAMFELPVDESESPWFCGPYAYPIFSAEPIPFVELKGTLGFFKIADELKFAA